MTPAVGLLADLAVNPEFPVEYLHVQLILLHPRQLDVDQEGVVDLGQVSGGYPRYIGTDHAKVPERRVHQLSHTLVDVLDFPCRVRAHQ